MKNVKSLVEILIQLTCFVGGILLLIFIMNELIPIQPGVNGQLPGYQPPQDQPVSQTAPPVNPQTAYPVPRTITPRSPMDATRRAFDLRTPSASEISAGATFMANKLQVAQNYTPQPAITPFTYPVNSIEDLPQVVYHDPFYGNVNSYDFGACIQAASPGFPLLIHSLDQYPDYYIIPFYEDSIICGLAMVCIKDNQGLVGGWSNYHFGDKYPPVSAEEAINQVMLNLNQNVIDMPILVFRAFQETSDPFVPLWKVTTSDGEVYYVLGIRIMMESGEVKTTITVMNANDMHPLQ
jgi:hypothetical protein